MYVGWAHQARPVHTDRSLEPQLRADSRFLKLQRSGLLQGGRPPWSLHQLLLETASWFLALPPPALPSAALQSLHLQWGPDLTQMISLIMQVFSLSSHIVLTAHLGVYR